MPDTNSQGPFPDARDHRGGGTRRDFALLRSFGLSVGMIGMVIAGYFLLAATLMLTERGANRPDAGVALALLAGAGVWAVAFLSLCSRWAKSQSQIVTAGLLALNLGRIGVALMRYVGDHAHTFPPMQDARTAKASLFPYIRDESVFLHPRTKESYRPNPYLSEKKVSQVHALADMVAFYEQTSSSYKDGRHVVLANGYVRWVRDAEWDRLKAESHLIDNGGDEDAR